VDEEGLSKESPRGPVSPLFYAYVRALLQRPPSQPHRHIPLDLHIAIEHAAAGDARLAADNGTPLSHNSIEECGLSNIATAHNDPGGNGIERDSSS
jgi:hypothetical protein